MRLKSLNLPSHRGLDALLILALGVFAFSLCREIGMRGAFIDDDLLFYGGWMVRNGQIPYLDFFSSNSVFGSVVLGGLFRLFGVSWSTFVVHASLFNAVFTALSFVLLRQLGLNRWLAAAYAVAAAHSYYTPLGYAHPDKDSFTYLLAALSLQLTCIGRDSGRHVVLVHMAGVWLMVAAFLSKSNPTGLYPLALMMPFLAFSLRNLRAAALGGLAGFASLAAVIGIMNLAHPGFAGDLYYYALKLPLSVGAARMSHGVFPALTKMADYARFPSFTLALAILVAALAACVITPKTLATQPGRARVLVPTGLALAFLLITAFHLSHIAQPQLSHVTLGVLIIGLSHAAILGSLGREAGEALRRARLLLGVVVAGYVLIDAREYHRIVNRPRLSYDVPLEAGSIQPPNTSGLRGFEGVRWVPLKTGDQEYLEVRRQLIATLDSVPGAVVIVGHSPAFYALSGKPPVVPANLVIIGHSTPPADSPEELRLAQHFQRNLKAAGVKTIVIGKLGEWVAQSRHACTVKRQEWISVVELCDGAWDDMDFVIAVLRKSGKEA